MGNGEPSVNDILLTISQALQLVAMAPCIFVIVFLLFTGRYSRENVLPALYFAALMCSFMLPLLGLVPFGKEPWVKGMLLFGENMTVAFSFLLILQFLEGNIPQAPYWFILALPIIGGTPFIYAMLSANEVCLGLENCYPTAYMRTLFNIFSTAMIFLLLIYKLSISSSRIAIEDIDRKHRYWLIMSIVVLNLVMAGFDLLMVAGKLPEEEVLLSSTIIRITFIYLVLTSIFAVFYELFEIDSNTDVPRGVDIDKELVEKVKSLLQEERIYREMGLTRKVLADKLGISEHRASRIINAYFRKNFNELVNTYRIEEAKTRLKAEETAITVIAFEVGFNSIASFNRVFKELAGTSPSEYRQKSKAEPAATASSGESVLPSAAAAK